MCVTGVVGQRLGGPVFTGGDQVPDEALDVLVTTVMQQAVGQQGSTDRFHVGLLQGALEATVCQDVTPPTPTTDRQGENGKVRLRIYRASPKFFLESKYHFLDWST